MTGPRVLTDASLLTIPEAAAELRISERQLFRIMAHGDVRTVHLGRRTLVQYRDLLKFVDERRR
ncbi:DNA-binding protein, excisionase family [Mycobacteroides abscessus subsp. abscessus]|uniref:DNA-binding protein, excisionase family n=1 Tax=Mycobacteroides abscessus subsp. abscessus TaxID=1185650 RepID=A0AB38D2X7_9MYCO|nr:hypothetical protein [Mycobacteroides abscessus]SHP54035.1 DNA-binding protein, excisionase family [Mycobacteroides abscessus subsp. abscessus]MBE5455767.1 hypothetical protein [Mycobacteroides abscessus]CPR93905.1 DNA-binding protein%2C excisionase family [Mycobacteroides abscessus]CPS18518.1 DNA-binding protein%2C excisionase family [Mycobacteroides abscessus]